MKTIKLITGIFLLAVAMQCFSNEVFIKTTINNAKELNLITKNSQNITIKMEPFQIGSDKLEQVGFDHIKISNDGSAVGWVSEYPNCCTSYPIPLKLSIYTNNKLYNFTGNGLPIWDWDFSSDGSKVIFHQETVHGGLGIHYEIREIKTNKLVDQWEPEIGQDNHPLPTQNTPKWVLEFNETQKAANSRD